MPILGNSFRKLYNQIGWVAFVQTHLVLYVKSLSIHRYSAYNSLVSDYLSQDLSLAIIVIFLDPL